MGNATATVAQQKVEQFNSGLDFAAAASPLILLSAFIALAAGVYGLRAARGCASSAHKFYAWKLACAVWAVLGGLFGRGSSLFQVMLAVYFAPSPAAAQLQADEALKQEAAVANSPIVYV